MVLALAIWLMTVTAYLTKVMSRLIISFAIELQIYVTNTLLA